jgi:isopenicillin N synthase-like dioxygenase
VVPTIDIGALARPGTGTADRDARRAVGERIGRACVETGCFLVVGHGIDPRLTASLHDAATRFFALPDGEKAEVAMRRGGRAWRGWFPVGGELTSGRPDRKEGLYFGTHLDPEHPAVRERRLLHGPNLYPRRPPELRGLVERWMAEVTAVGRVVLRGVALGLGLDEDAFAPWCADPTVLFRIFRYPAAPTGGTAARGEPDWGVGEHTDYGLLTLLAQDAAGGLEVRVRGQWVPVPFRPGSLVCNVGDMMEVATGGRVRSAPHRVPVPERDRVSFALFLDPAWDAVVVPLTGDAARTTPNPARGPTYGEYLTAKVAPVFPELFAQVSGAGRPPPDASATTA